MKATIVTTNDDYGYGFIVKWHLHLTFGKKNPKTKTFYLGQDVKFCTRVLGLSPYLVVQNIGGNDIDNPQIRVNLANFIISHLGLTAKDLKSMQIWELSAE